MPTPSFEKSSEKVGVGILVIDFQGNILMSSDRFQNKFLFNLRRHSTLCDLPFRSYVDKPITPLRNLISQLDRAYSNTCHHTDSASLGSLN